MQHQQVSKKCLICRTTFYKTKTKSLKSWNEIAKYCSRSCSAISVRDVTIARNKKGQGRKATEETKSKMSKARIGKPSTMLGKKHSEATKLLIKRNTIQAQTPEVRLKKSLAHRGSKSYNWKGGRLSLKHGMRTNSKYLEWRKSVFERDSYTCLWCKDSRGGNLEADHIKTVAEIFDEFSIIDIHQVIACEQLWDIANGRTLCKSCHIERHRVML